MFSLLAFYSDWALLVVRVILGLILVVHGYPKIKSLKTTALNFEAMGFRPGRFWGTLVAVVEFVGGLALLVGAYTQIVAAIIAIEFIEITIWKLRQSQPFVGGYEFDLLILGVAILLAVLGAGAYSLDHPLFFWRF